MPAIVVPINALALGAGYLYWAPLLSAVPANTVVGSVFTDVWPGAWLPFGATDSGSDFSYKPNMANVDVAEYYDPAAIVSVGRDITILFALAQVHMTNWKRALNGGTVTVTGSGSTTLSAYTPPTVGTETRAMIGWESNDGTERLILYQALQMAEVKWQRNKGAAKATIPVQYQCEIPSGGVPFQYWTAGTVRA
jgi:hypothetical protein